MRSSKARMTHLRTCQQSCEDQFDHGTVFSVSLASAFAVAAEFIFRMTFHDFCPLNSNIYRVERVLDR